MWGWGGGCSKEMFPVMLPNQINSLQKKTLVVIKVQLLWVLAVCDCMEPWLRCMQINPSPPDPQTSRSHPLRSTDQPPLYSTSPSDVQVRGDQQTDQGSSWFDADFTLTIWSGHASAFGSQTSLPNVLWNCWYVLVGPMRQSYLFKQAWACKHRSLSLTALWNMFYRIWSVMRS